MHANAVWLAATGRRSLGAADVATDSYSGRFAVPAESWCAHFGAWPAAADFGDVWVENACHRAVLVGRTARMRDDACCRCTRSWPATLVVACDDGEKQTSWL